VRRREFIRLLGGATTWPVAARAQQAERMRRLGVLIAASADDTQVRNSAFLQGLEQLGWTVGGNVRIDTRWATANGSEIRRHATELAELAPDVILAVSGTATMAPLLQATRTVPIVFALVIDPVGAGFVANLARPGGSHRVHGFRIHYQRKMAGAAQGDRAPRDASRRPSRSGYCLRDRTVRRCPGHGAVVGGGVDPGRRARCR
jgi:putative tryptophan/tyrosine transport system substrate-binding protein